MRGQIESGLPVLLPRLRRFAITLTGSEADADDLVRHACARVREQADHVSGLTRIDSWIYGIMRELWRDKQRSHHFQRHGQINTAAYISGGTGVATTEGPITLAAVRHELAALPEEQRVVLVLVCVDGLDYKEAAEVLDIPVSTVMSRLARARQDLHERLHRQNRNDIVTPMLPRSKARLGARGQG
jgi:RNA polymerase sigma-70 factor (ECF subfamily)